MSEHQHHTHHHHREDDATKFKKRSLQSIAFRRKLDKWLKIILFVVAILMILLVVLSFIIG